MMKFTQNEQNIARAITDVGGTICAVGGSVRDMVIAQINGTPVISKDMDVEVRGISVEDIMIAVTPHCKSAGMVGAKFGVINIVFDDGEMMDISVARRENKVSNGKRGFVVEFDPTITQIEAASRRDFTFNAMTVEMTKGHFNDFFGGIADLERGIIRHIVHQGKTAFAEDATRVLRGMQFAARFNMTVAPETAEICAHSMSEFHTISKEMVWVEFSKVFEKGIKPSKAIRFLRETGWVVKFPEIEQSVTDVQCDRMDNFAGDDIMVMASMFIEAGVEVASSFMKAINAPTQTRKAVVEVVRRCHNRVTSISEIRRMVAMTRLIEGRHIMPMGFEGVEIGKAVQSAWIAQMDGVFNSVEDGVEWVKRWHTKQP